MAAIAPLAPLAMSQTKDDLLKHLNLPPETYALMAKETDQVYKWLTSDKHHLKKNCKRNPPYDWSDINEKSKDDAMSRIARGGDQYTSYYWNLAPYGAGDCPNWIARWFLYHKFRYRDGRNRNLTKDEGKSHHGNSSKHHHHHNQYQQSASEDGGEYYNAQANGYYTSGSMTSDPSASGWGSTEGQSSSSSGYSYDTGSSGYIPNAQVDDQAKAGYYDPVRDSVN